MLQRFLLIAAGGAIGALLRYGGTGFSIQRYIQKTKKNEKTGAVR